MVTKATKKKQAAGQGGTQIKVMQTGSLIGRDKPVKETVKALGLGRVGKTSLLPDNAGVRGMIKKVNYLVQIQDGK